MGELIVLALTALLMAYAGRKLGKVKKINDEIYNKKVKRDVNKQEQA